MAQVLQVDPALLGHSVFLLGTIIIGQLVGFVVQIFIARQLGTEGYGVYSYAFAWVSLLSMVAIFGNERLIVRYGSEYLAANGGGLFNGLIGWACRWSIGGAMVLALGFVAVCVAAGWPAGYGVSVAIWTALAVPLFVAGALIEAMLRANEAHVVASLANRMLRPIFFGGIVLSMTWLTAGGLDTVEAIAGNTLAILLSVAIVLAASLPRIPAERRETTAIARRMWTATSLAFGVNAVAIHLGMLIDIIIMGLFHDNDVVGIYGAVQRLMLVMSFAGVSVITIIQPMIVKTLHGQDQASLQRLVSGGARLVCAASLAIGLPLLILAEPILAIFGEGFEAGATALRIHVAAALFAAAINLAGPLLGMTGHERDATIVVVLGCLLTIGLNFLLIPGLGLTGAAIATAGSRVVWNLALFILAWRRVRIWAAPVAWRR